MATVGTVTSVPEASKMSVADAPLVLLFDVYPAGLFGAQRTMLELSAAGTGSPGGYRSLAVVVEEGPHAEALRQSGVDTLVVRYGRPLRRYGGALLSRRPMSKLLALPALIGYNLRVARLIRSRRVDVVYCSNTRSVVSAGLGARLMRRPVIWYVQIENSLGRFDRIAARLATHIVVLSASVDRLLAPSVCRSAMSRISTIPLGVSLGSQPGAQDEDTGREDVRLALIGSIGRRKGHDVLLEVLDRLDPETASSMRVRFIGEAIPAEQAYRTELAASTERLGLTDRVVFAGWSDSIDEVLAETDLLVVPSQREGLPRVIIEAMAAGVPVVAFDVGAVCDLVIDGVTGRLVPAADIDQFAAALTDMIQDRERRRAMGIAARSHVQRAFDPDRFLAGFNDLFLSAARSVRYFRRSR
jgi:glycosyltransferase involved in cell wall biosynthesis